MTNPGEALKKWRDERGLSQVEAGKQLSPPVTQGCWGAWETGRKPPNLGNALGLQALTGGAVPAASWPADSAKRAKRRKRSARKSGTDVAASAARSA